MGIEGPVRGGLLRTADAVELAPRRWEPARPSGVGVVLVHGFTASKDHPDVVAVAERLRAEGHSVLSYDARGHGQSDGRCSLGAREHHDVAAAVGVLRHSVDRVVAIGASMGAIAALRYAACADDLAGVVIVSAPAQWRLPRNARGALSAVLTQTAPGRWFVAKRMHVRLERGWEQSSPPVELISSVHVPVAVVHGRDDRFIPPSDAGELFAAANEPRRLLLVDGLGHAFEPLAVPAIIEALAWVLERDS